MPLMMDGRTDERTDSQSPLDDGQALICAGRVSDMIQAAAAAAVVMLAKSTLASGGTQTTSAKTSSPNYLVHFGSEWHRRRQRHIIVAVDWSTISP